MNAPTEIENLIARYLNGACNDNELLDLHNWISLSDQNKKDALELKDVWDASQSIPEQSNNQLLHFYRTQYEKSRKSQVIFLRRVVAIAAVLVVGLILGISYFSNNSPGSSNLQVFSVPLGSRSSVILPDGTEINLNAGSVLSYASDYSSKNRQVTLTGEAFFHVKSDTWHPFVVKTKDFDVQVTGTQFNLCAYSEDQFSNTTLVEGKISLKMNSSGSELIVKPGEKFVMDRNSNKYSLKVTDVSQEVAWKVGEFIFKNISFPDLVRRLERWYDVKLIISDSKLMKYNYTGSFKNQETIWQVLDALKLTSPVDYKKSTFREFQLSYKTKLTN